jgi:hypothetical protein
MKFPLSVLLALVLSTAPARADVTFSFDYSGSTEFNDTTNGAARKAALEDAAAKLGRIFDHTAVVTIKVTSSNNSNGDTLAYAGSEYGDLPGNFVGYTPGVIQKKILTGDDDNGAALDGEVNVNFGFGWDLDDDVSSGLYDFKATIIHEILHTLGFLSGIYDDGSDAWGTSLGDPGIWEPFDDFLSDKNGTPLINDSTFALNVAAWGAMSVGGASPGGGLFFNGPLAAAANGGQPVGLYTPTSWEEGSSGSHLDDENSALAGSLMLATTDTGRFRRSLTDVERGILEDIGYTLHPLPALTLEVTRVNPGVSAELRLAGPEDRWYAVEGSGDLLGWDEIDAVEMAGAATTLTVPLAASDQAQYFRLRETGMPEAAQAARGVRFRARR